MSIAQRDDLLVQSINQRFPWQLFLYLRGRYKNECIEGAVQGFTGEVGHHHFLIETDMVAFVDFGRRRRDPETVAAVFQFHVGIAGGIDNGNDGSFVVRRFSIRSLLRRLRVLRFMVNRQNLGSVE